MMEKSDEDTGISPSKRAKLTIAVADEVNGHTCNEKEDKRLCCIYGSSCYRRSPDHLKKYKHLPKSPIAANLPPCKYGASCCDRNLLHFAMYYHPTDNTKMGKLDDVSEESSNDAGVKKTVDIECNECAIEKSQDQRLTRDDTILKRGPSIMRTYSILNEEQRRDLIKRAFEMKQVLMKKLSDTEESLKTKIEELEILRLKLDKNSLMVEGEAEALNGESIKYFPLYPQRKYKEDSAAEIHFRLAESQFYRLLRSGSACKVTKVEYVVQPELIKRFKKARETIKAVRGEEASLPVLGFHGTKEQNIESICDSGFRVPGEQSFQHATDPGWYGKGVYFSEYPRYSMNYIKDSSKLLLCQVLPGKVYRCRHIIQGEQLRHGYDSHMSPDGKEVVIFNSHHILPSYIVHYTVIAGDFYYEKDE